jgi:hypothetical protein
LSLPLVFVALDIISERVGIAMNHQHGSLPRSVKYGASPLVGSLEPGYFINLDRVATISPHSDFLQNILFAT